MKYEDRLEIIKLSRANSRSWNKIAQKFGISTEEVKKIVARNEAELERDWRRPELQNLSTRAYHVFMNQRTTIREMKFRIKKGTWNPKKKRLKGYGEKTHAEILMWIKSLK